MLISAAGLRKKSGRFFIGRCFDIGEFQGLLAIPNDSGAVALPVGLSNLQTAAKRNRFSAIRQLCVVDLRDALYRMFQSGASVGIIAGARRARSIHIRPHAAAAAPNRPGRCGGCILAALASAVGQRFTPAAGQFEFNRRASSDRNYADSN